MGKKGKKKKHHADKPKKSGDEREPGSDDIADAEHLSDAEFEAYQEKRLENVNASIVASSMVDTRDVASDVHIVINRGKDDGVRVGDAGIIKGLDEPFTVVEVNANNCVARTDAGMDQIDAHKNVILNPS